MEVKLNRYRRYIYPKIPGILNGMRYYSELIAPLMSQPIPKSKQVFGDKKVTDHHAIYCCHYSITVGCMRRFA